MSSKLRFGISHRGRRATPVKTTAKPRPRESDEDAPARLVIPKTIMIKGAQWKIYQEPDTSEHRLSDAAGKTLDQQGLYGIAYRDAKEIHLARSLRGERLERVFMHELLHAVMPSTTQVVSDRTEEKVVNVMATPLTEALRQLRWRR